MKFGRLALVAACLFATSAMAQEPIVIKFSHVVAPDTPKGRAAERFKELAQQYTDAARPFGVVGSLTHCELPNS